MDQTKPNTDPINPSRQPPQLLLGTAMWGWTVAAPAAHRLLEDWYAAGLRKIDTATNYPINLDPADWRRSEGILQDWIAAHGVRDLEVIVKVGSLNNLRTPDHNLSASFLRLNAEEYAAAYGDNFHTLMLHWDNRSEAAEVAETLEVLHELSRTGIQAGLSGIKYPAIYRNVLASYPDWRLPLEAKHNILQSDLDRYAGLAHWADFYVYGLNAGGIKLDDSYRNDASLLARGGRPPADATSRRLSDWLAAREPSSVRPRSMNEIGLLYAYCDPRVAGILLGPSNEEQLGSSLAYLATLADDAGQETFHSLRECLADASA